MGADGVLIGEILMNAPDKNKKYLSHTCRQLECL